METASVFRSCLIALVFLGIFPVFSISENIGFLFTAPKTFLSGYDENLCLTLRNQSEAVQIKVVILEQKEDNEIASVTEDISENGGKCFKISMPKTKIKKGRLQLTIHLKTEEDFKINYIEQILIQTNPVITFIQTDKLIYNSGHIVRFRVLTLRSDLTPVLEPVDRIWIENPNGIRIMQWLYQPTKTGFVTETFKLSKEPVPGKWYIKVKRKNEEIISQNFFVENYMLPKFSVSIKTPEYIDLSAQNIITICARYIFGEPVHGEVNIEYFVKCSFSYYCQESGSSRTQNLRLDSDGCLHHKISLKNLSSFAQSLIINATVIEDGTRVREKASSKIEIQNSKKKSQSEFSVEVKHRKFKPGLPFKGHVVISKPEAHERVLVCLDINEEKNCKELEIRKNITEFLILPVQVKNEKNFKAFLEMKNLKESHKPNQIKKLNLVPWYSPSNSYLLIENLSNKLLLCGQKARLNVLYSDPESSSSLQFHYMVKARGDILAKGTLDGFSTIKRPFEIPKNANAINQGDLRNVWQFEFLIDVTTMMAPHSYLIVYYIRHDGEVVADSLKLRTEKCLPTKVLTRWSQNPSMPGSGNKFLIETTSHSFCALTVTDKSIKLMSVEEPFDEDKIFRKMDKFDVKSLPGDNNANRCKENPERAAKAEPDDLQPLSYPHESDSRFIDSLQAFNDFGALVITDLDLETRPCKEKGDEVLLKNATTRNSKINVYGNEIENISILKTDDDLNNNQPSLREPNLIHEVRSFFPETWLWDLVQINDSGTVELDVVVPHTLTEWTAETVCLSLTKGLGVSSPSKLVIYQPFFLDFAVPYSVKRKEIFHLHVSVFNYESTDLPVKITLSSKENFISRSEESHSYCIKTKSKIVHRFVLESVKLGEAEIKVKAETDLAFGDKCGTVVSSKSDVVVKKTIVKHEGFPVEEVKSAFICGESPHFDRQIGWNIKIPADAVESSISLQALVSGDILGPSLENIEHLITLPTGCGEQNMMLLVPNILLLDYLLLIEVEELEPIEKALKNLDVGYQRQLNYKRKDGSYSAFGKQDEKGSIWLTAFVVRYLSQAEKYIYINENDLGKSFLWITKHQLENGCFPMVGKIYHRKLQEKLLEDDSSKTLTAYILISLIEAGISLEDPVVKNAIYCLKPTEESLGIYGDLLSSYALILAGEYRDSQALMIEMLREAKRSYGMLWWEDDDSIESSIEMTGYGILTLIKLGGPLFLAAASDAVRWIIQFQNQNGGFISSQDTVLALEAISKFSATLPRTNKDDLLSIRLKAQEKKHEFNISNTNRLLQQEITLPSYLTEVHFESTGKGCALVQTLLKYNIRRAKHNENLKIQLRIHSVSDVDLYSVARFHVCVRYRSPKDKITMAVLEVSMVSGYYPDRSSLYEIRTSSKGVRRWEEYEDKINFYFGDLGNRKVCVSFLVIQEICVENSSPALIKLYDYYNTQYRTSVRYSLTRECQNNTWLDIPSYDVKQESKRELKYQKVHVPNYQRNKYNDDNFQGFIDVDHDLETPKNEGDAVPVFALPPQKEPQAHYCPHCLSSPPDLFPKLYCSSKIAVKVLILNSQTFEFHLDLSPRQNLTSIRKTVSFTMRENCDCPILKSVNTNALLLVTPPRHFNVKYVQELHIDDSFQIYPWGNPNQMPKYVRDAINYCQRWYNGNS